MAEVSFADNGSEVRVVWPVVRGGVGLVNVDNAANRVAGCGEGRLQPRQVLGGVINHFLAEVGADDIVASEQRFLQDGAGAAEGVKNSDRLVSNLFDRSMVLRTALPDAFDMEKMIGGRPGCVFAG